MTAMVAKMAVGVTIRQVVSAIVRSSMMVVCSGSFPDFSGCCRSGLLLISEFTVADLLGRSNQGCYVER